jgi:hypothetical protein
MIGMLPSNHAVKSVQNWLISSLLVLSYIFNVGICEFREIADDRANTRCSGF